MLRKIVLNLLFFGAALGFGLSLSQRPWRVYRQQRALSEGQASATRRAEQDRVRDLELEARYGSAEGREELARKQGYRRTDEVPIQP